MLTRQVLDNIKRGYWATRSSPVTRHVASVVYWVGLLWGGLVHGSLLPLHSGNRQGYSCLRGSGSAYGYTG